MYDNLSMMESGRKIYTVSEVNRKARAVLESALGELWVEGELSRVIQHASGHWYFTLKDEGASVSCAMFKGSAQRVPFTPTDGMKVQLLGQPGIYEAGGRYQLVVSAMEEAGKGSLQAQFEKLKAKLADEGLFGQDRKKPLPKLPRRIGIVTSPTGAAVRDILQVLTRRFPNLEILLVPARVQGAGAEKGLADAVAYLNGRGDIDLIIIGRGGGSMEDLWCFNAEILARAIADSEVPVISAVGHEIDFTIADFVADVRAPTPSAAAELAVPEKGALAAEIRQLRMRMSQRVEVELNARRLRLERSSGSMVFREPAALVGRSRQTLSRLQGQMKERLAYGVLQERQRIERGETALMHQLKNELYQTQQRIDEVGLRVRHRMERTLDRNRQRLSGAKAQLRVLNPLAVLGRGYSLTSKADGTVVRKASDLKPNERMTTRLADGKVISNVESIE